MPNGPDDGRISRRLLLARGAVSGLGLWLLPSGLSARLSFGLEQGEGVKDDRRYLQAAVQAARWLRSVQVKTADGLAWPVDPAKPEHIETDLYHGTSGVVLFFVEAYRSTGDESYLKDAQAGGEYLLSKLPKSGDDFDCGLYTGLSGVAFALIEAGRYPGGANHRGGSRRCIKLLKAKAVKKGAGVEWTPTTDIISGNAGIGLFLLYAAREIPDKSLVDLAAQAGRRLVELGKPAGGGMKWAMNETFPRLMPNFSHGTAGVAYFLASLYRQTREKAFLDAAVAGGTYLRSVADTEGNACLIFHNEPDGKDLYYLSWCHGPAGTARLFYHLYRITNDKEWLEWVHKGARAVMRSGVPEKRTEGFWNNAGQCCGSAGVAEFFLNLYLSEGTWRAEYKEVSIRVADDLLSRATKTDGGVKWVQAEHRVQPENLAAQTGYMQGAAGIGMLLLHMQALDSKRQWWRHVRFSDSPWAAASPIA